jgi:hypothetical protein
MSRFWGGRQIWCGWASKLVVGGGDVKSQKEASTATDWQIYHQTAKTAYFRCTIELLLDNGGWELTRSTH